MESWERVKLQTGNYTVVMREFSVEDSESLQKKEVRGRTVANQGKLPTKEAAAVAQAPYQSVPTPYTLIRSLNIPTASLPCVCMVVYRGKMESSEEPSKWRVRWVINQEKRASGK